MSKNIECEERVMLTKDQYEDVLSYYKNHHIVHEKEIQNFYFDYNDFFLIKNHYMLRIRISNKNRYTLTLKIKGSDGDIEINQSVTKNEFQNAISNGIIPDGEVLKNLNKFAKNSAKLKYIADLQCFRSSFKIENCLIEIDKNRYCGIEDYDIEIEASTMKLAKEKIEQICNNFKITYCTNYMVKSARVFTTVQDSSQQRVRK